MQGCHSQEKTFFRGLWKVRKFCIKSVKILISQGFFFLCFFFFSFCLASRFAKSFLVGRGNVVSNTIYEWIDFCCFIAGPNSKWFVLYSQCRKMFTWVMATMNWSSKVLFVQFNLFQHVVVFPLRYIKIYSGNYYLKKIGVALPLG